MIRISIWYLVFGIWCFQRLDAQPRLYVSVLETRGFIVGSDNASSGMYRLDASGAWDHLGWKNTRNFGIDGHPSRPNELFMACGNGVIRSLDAGATWRIVTDWRITEVLDVSVDRNRDDYVYIATAHGIWRSLDGGDSWAEAIGGLVRPRDTFIQSIEADAVKAGRVLAGSEVGLFASEDYGETWTPVGPRDVAIRDIRQAAASPDRWLAGTEDRGVLISNDGGRSWDFAGGKIAGATIYAVASDPSDPEIMTAAGYDTGLYVSTNGGRTWRTRSGGGDARTIHALRFDDTGRLWIGGVASGMFSSADLGKTWVHEGLEGAVIYDILLAEAGDE